MYLIRLILISLILITSLSLFAQKPPIKFGKVEMKDLTMSVYEKDSSAGAVVLCDYGESKIVYDQTFGFQIVFERVTRIKIFNKSEYDRASVEIQVYHDGANKEKISGLKGYTYNLVNGKIITSKLEKNGVFEEVYDENRDITKFALPNVKEGSVIEYTYKITSDFLFNFYDWEFQNTIPVIWSEYNTVIPEYFHYQKLSQGYLSFSINESKDITASLAIKTKTRTIGEGVADAKTNFETKSIGFRQTQQRLVIEHAPAFKNEAYMTTYKSYISKINYEIAYTKFPEQPINNIMGDWETLNNKFLTSENFGAKLNAMPSLNKVVEELTTGIEDPIEKAIVIYNYVKNKVSWNDRYRLTLDASLQDAVNSRNGSSAQINLLLANMLLKAGLEVDPVIISTRNHGLVQTQYSITEQFNYTICQLKIGKTNYLLDATDRYTPFGVLPQRCLNGQGFVVSRNNSGWVNLEANIKSGTKTSGIIKLNNEGAFEGSLKQEYIGYNAFNSRKKYFEEGEEEYIKNQKNDSEWTYNNYQLDQTDDINTSFIETFEFESESNLLGDLIYFNPLIAEKIDKNPFTIENRTYPVDFACPFGDLMYISFEIPEGYIVEELPETLSIVLPNNSVTYIYQITSNKNILTILSKLEISKTLFLPSEYANLKNFFGLIVAKQNEQIVLKKL